MAGGCPFLPSLSENKWSTVSGAATTHGGSRAMAVAVTPAMRRRRFTYIVRRHRRGGANSGWQPPESVGFTWFTGKATTTRQEGKFWCSLAIARVTMYSATKHGDFLGFSLFSSDWSWLTDTWTTSACCGARCHYAIAPPPRYSRHHLVVATAAAAPQCCLWRLLPPRRRPLPLPPVPLDEAFQGQPKADFVNTWTLSRPLEAFQTSFAI